MLTANWSIVSNESSFEKKEENGYLVFSKNGTLSVIYKKKGKNEEARIEFYSNKENSTDKKSICECKITTLTGEDRIKKGFSDINLNNVGDILATFFDYADLEKIEKNSVDRFLMGFSKCMKEIVKTSESDQLSPSFNMFRKYIDEWAKKSNDQPVVSQDKYDFLEIVKKFIAYFKS